MSYLKIIILVLFVVCNLLFGIYSPANAELAELGIYPFSVEPGSRPLGLGGAFAAIDDVSSSFYNPGGMAWAKGIGFTVRNAGNLSVLQAYPLGNNASLGLGVITRKYSNMPITGGTANSDSTLIALSYGSKLTYIPFLYDQPFFKRLGFGITIKGLMSQTLQRTGQADISGTGIEADFGLLWKGGDYWNVGLCLQNGLSASGGELGSIKWNNGSKEGIPARLKLGAAIDLIGDYSQPIRNDEHGVLLAAELDFYRSSATNFRLGGEWSYLDQYYVRAGVMELGVNLGFGLRQEDWGVDLASYVEPAINERSLRLSVLYFPKEWIVVKNLDLPRPTISLEDVLQSISLQDNVSTYDDRINIAGKVKPGVAIYINGSNVAVNDDFTFNAVVPLRMQKNLVLVEARYEGESKVWKYKVLRKAKVTVKEEEQIKAEIKKAQTPEEKEALRKKEENIIEARQQLESLVTLGVIEIKPDEQFVMQAGITRGELATWIVRARELKLPLVNEDLYKDVPRNNPLAPYVKAVVEAGIMQPYPDGTFRPNAFISKQEGEFIFKKFKK